jgi:hypothetical protein
VFDSEGQSLMVFRNTAPARLYLVLCFLLLPVCWASSTTWPSSVPAMPGPPIPPPAYMVDNTRNDHYSWQSGVPSMLANTTTSRRKVGPRQAGSSYWWANMAHGVVSGPRKYSLDVQYLTAHFHSPDAICTIWISGMAERVELRCDR